MSLLDRAQGRVAFGMSTVLLVIGAGCRGSSSPPSERGRPALEARSLPEPTDAAASDPDSGAEADIEQAVVKAIGRSLTARTLSVKPWRYRPDSLLALVFAAGETFTSTQQLDIHIVVLEREGAAVKAVATASFVPAIETDPSWELNDPELALDLAPYEIRHGEYAFGVRFGYRTVFPAGESTSQELYLFRLQGGTLSPILSTVVKSTDEQRGPNDLSGSEAVVVVSPETTRGFNDVLVKTRSTYGPLLGDAPGSRSAEAGASTGTQRWRWSGAAYRKDDDPKR